MESNYLRSTMSTDRLSGIAKLHAHNEMRVDTEAVNDFVGRSIDKIQELPTNGGLTALPPTPPLAVFLRTLHLPADVRLSQELVTKYLIPI